MSTRSTGPVNSSKKKLINKIKGTIDDIWGSADEALKQLKTPSVKTAASTDQPTANTEPATIHNMAGNKEQNTTAKGKGRTVVKAVQTATKRTVAKKAAVKAKTLRDEGKRD